MYIKIIGASVNAAVMAYHLSEVGHQVLWKPYDQLLVSHLQQKAILFDNYELTHGLQEQIISLNLLIDCVHNESQYKIVVVAVNNEQYTAFDEILIALKEDNADLIINYSNLGLGKTQELKRVIGKTNVVYIPDFLNEERIISSFKSRNLIVGCDQDDYITCIYEIFRPIFPQKQQYNFMSVLAAEFTKLSISGFLATKISFMNDLSNVAEALGIDIEEVRIAMSTDERIGAQYLYPGCGFGGQNFTRDILTLKDVVLDTGNINYLLDKIWDINENQKEIVFRKIWKLFNCNLNGKVVAIWGAAFKPNSNSIVQAPTLKVLEACWSQGAITRVHDPRALAKLQELYPHQSLLQICHDPYQAAEGADVLCLMTEWKQYWSPNYRKLTHIMRQKNIIDGRNIYNPLYVENQGFSYIGIGR